MLQRSLTLAAVSLSSLLISACGSDPFVPSPAEGFKSCNLETNDPQQPIAGCSVETFDSIEEPGGYDYDGCGGIGVSASAMFEHKGSSVSDRSRRRTHADSLSSCSKVRS